MFRRWRGRKVSGELLDEDLRNRIINVTRHPKILVGSCDATIEADVVLPTHIIERAELQNRQYEGLHEPYYRNGARARGSAKFRKQCESAVTELFNSARKNVPKQLLFGSEMIMKESQLNARTLGDVSGRYGVELALREQSFGCIEKTFFRRGASGNRRFLRSSHGRSASCRREGEKHTRLHFSRDTDRLSLEKAWRGVRLEIHSAQPPSACEP